MTENVTALFDNYRLCLREVWNDHLWHYPERRTWDSSDSFARLQPHIFQALVLDALEPANPRFLVVPNVPDNFGNLLTTHVTVLKKRDAVEELLTLRSTDETLRYLDVFDWSMMRYVDFPHYLAEITAFATRPNLAGSEVLIDVHQVEIWVEWEDAPEFAT